MTRKQVYWEMLRDWVVLIVAAVVFVWILNAIWSENPEGKAANARAKQKAALELRCTQNNGVPEWWDGQFICIQKGGER